MKRPLLLALAAAALGCAGWAMLTYPAVGGLALNADTRIETAIAGLRRATVDVGDSRMMSWQGGPADASETVVMIHGYSADKTVWMRFAPHFTDRYRVLVLDLPGHGETPFDPAIRFDTLSQAQRVLKAMDALGIARAHLVGNSMGGFIAAQLALHHPERVQSATLMDAAGVIAPRWNFRLTMIRAQRCIRQKSAPTFSSGDATYPRSHNNISQCSAQPSTKNGVRNSCRCGA